MYNIRMHCYLFRSLIHLSQHKECKGKKWQGFSHKHPRKVELDYWVSHIFPFFQHHIFKVANYLLTFSVVNERHHSWIYSMNLNKWTVAFFQTRYLSCLVSNLNKYLTASNNRCLYLTMLKTRAKSLLNWSWTMHLSCWCWVRNMRHLKVLHLLWMDLCLNKTGEGMWRTSLPSDHTWKHRTILIKYLANIKPFWPYTWSIPHFQLYKLGS